MRWQDAWEPSPAAAALARAWTSTLAVPVRTPVHEALLDGARWWTARDEHDDTLWLRVADGLLLELLPPAGIDSEFLAAAYREAGPAAGVRQVRFRSDDSVLLPLTMTGRPPADFRRSHRLWVQGPRPWHAVRHWTACSADEFDAGLRQKMRADQAPQAQVVECAEGDAVAARLQGAGYTDAVQVYEAAWQPGTQADRAGP